MNVNVLEIELSLIRSDYKIYDNKKNLIGFDSVSCSGLKTHGEKLNRLFLHLLELKNEYSIDFVVYGFLVNSRGITVNDSMKNHLGLLVHVLFSDSLCLEGRELD